MTDNPKDGGPAFGHMLWDSHLHRPHHVGGMSLRDYFAGQALAGMGTWCPDYRSDGNPVGTAQNLVNPGMQKARAEWAYAQADAMLKQRSQ